MLLECFTLKKLKEILKYLQDSDCIQKQPKVYNINKYDTIVLLRNSGFCDEDRPKELGVFNGGWHKYYKSDFKNKYYKGKNTGFKIKHGEYVVKFE